MSLRSICVYCGSADGVHPAYYQAAAAMGRVIARRGMTLVYGAGKTGLMGAVAEGALSAGGEVVGVVCENLNQPQLIHDGLSAMEIVPDIQARKARMAELAEAFIALPGGYGTLDELFETLTWAQIGMHHKAIGLLNTRGFFRPLLRLIAHSERTGFIYPEHSRLIVTAAYPRPLLEALEAYAPPEGLERWITREG